MKKKRLAIIGAGELGMQVLHYSKNCYDVVAFFDDLAASQTLIGNIPVLGGIKDVYSFYQEKSFDTLFIAIGYKNLKFKSEIYNELKNKIPFATIVTQNCYIDSSAHIGSGVIIYPGCIIDKNVIIEDGVLLNLGVTVSHDSIIGANSFLAPRVSVAGFSKIGENCFCGINSTIIDNISISSGIQLGAGTVVTSNLSEVGLYTGIPSRKNN
ncbi:MAG: hypothetical protein LIO65_05625 [Odoribacter sp.]|nr:hypothetical protein [Odoribacter sp.]